MRGEGLKLHDESWRLWIGAPRCKSQLKGEKVAENGRPILPFVYWDADSNGTMSRSRKEVGKTSLKFTALKKKITILREWIMASPLSRMALNILFWECALSVAIATMLSIILELLISGISFFQLFAVQFSGPFFHFVNEKNSTTNHILQYSTEFHGTTFWKSVQHYFV